MFRPWRNFPFMVAAGLVTGLLTGGFPAYAREVAEVALVVAMAFSLTEISFAGISPRAELRGFVLALGMSYVALTGLLLGFAAWTADSDLRDGWVLMAAVPPAVAVIPVTSLLKGDTRGALLSSAVTYLLGLALVPAITLAFVGRAVPVTDLAIQTLLLIGLPLVVSRPLRRMPRVHDLRPVAVGASFFFLVLAISGSTRAILLASPERLASLSALSLARTFGMGLAVVVATALLRLPRATRITATTFASFKNLGLAVVFAFAFSGPAAALPSIVSLVFEILWLAALPFLFRSAGRADESP